VCDITSIRTVDVLFRSLEFCSVAQIFWSVWMKLGLAGAWRSRFIELRVAAPLRRSYSTLPISTGTGNRVWTSKPSLDVPATTGHMNSAAACSALPPDFPDVVDPANFRKQLKAHYLWSPYGIGQTIIFLPCGYFFFLFFPRLISAVADWMSAILPHMVWP